MKLKDSYPTKQSTSSSPDRKYGNDSFYQLYGFKVTFECFKWPMVTIKKNQIKFR